jgi:ATP-dependent Clp protease protease subunit
MIHQVSSGAYGQNADIQIAAKESQKWQNLLYNILSKNTGKSFDQINEDADRDHWFMAQEALEYGLIDEIITKKK